MTTFLLAYTFLVGIVAFYIGRVAERATWLTKAKNHRTKIFRGRQYRIIEWFSE